MNVTDRSARKAARAQGGRRRTDAPDASPRQLFEQFVRAAPLPVAILDSRFRLAGMSEPASALLGRSQDEPLGLADIGLNPRLLRSLDPATPHVTAPFRVRGDDNEGWAVAELKPWLEADGRIGGLLAMFRDVTERLRTDTEVEQLAFRDPLTGLANRTLFLRRLHEAVSAAEQQAEKFGIVVLDVDYFKDVNDTLGHDAGDALLRGLGEMLTRSFRHTDTVARLGGDEFVVILRNLHTAEDLERPIAVLRQLTEEPIVYRGQSIRVSASIGAAFHCDPDSDPELMIKNADLALFQAKQAGRDCAVMFQPAMRTELEQRAEILRDVRAAIALDEMRLHYQPVIRLRDDHLAGIEALMRWDNPDQGLLEASRFAVAFDDPDLCQLLGERAIQFVTRQMRQWQDEGVDYGRVSVNIGSAHFRHQRFVRQVFDAVDAAGVPRDKLMVEVKEQTLMGRGAGAAAEAVRQLDAGGIGVILDDFGAGGYALLADLRMLPIRRLKIDRSYLLNDRDRTLTGAIIALGRSLGLTVIAVGVETEDQRRFVTEQGCIGAQGRLFSMAQPADALTAFIRSRRLL